MMIVSQLWVFTVHDEDPAPNLHMLLLVEHLHLAVDEPGIVVVLAA